MQVVLYRVVPIVVSEVIGTTTAGPVVTTRIETTATVPEDITTTGEGMP